MGWERKGVVLSGKPYIMVKTHQPIFLFNEPLNGNEGEI